MSDPTRVARLRARLLEFLKFRVLAAQEAFEQDLRDRTGALDPSRLRAWLATCWPEALALSDADLVATFTTARRLYSET